MRCLWTTCLAWGLLAASAAGQPQMTPEMKALYDRMEEIRRTTREPLREQIDQRRAALEKEADLNSLRANLEAARKAYETRTTTDQAIVEAQKAVAAAEKALPEIAETRLANHPKLQVVQKDLEALKASLPQLMTEHQQLRRQLNELEQQIASSAEMESYRKAMEAAEQAYYAVPRTDPKFVTARGAVEAAQKALDDKIRDLPEKKALDEAQKAYEELQRTSAELAAARQARTQARDAYQQRLEQLVRHDPKGAEIRRKLDDLEQRQMVADAQRQALNQELYEVRREAEKSDPEITQARQAIDQAQQKLKQTIAERAEAERKAVDQARQAYDQKLQEKVASDFLTKDLRERMMKADKEIMELQRQFQQLRRQGREGGEGG